MVALAFGFASCYNIAVLTFTLRNHLCQITRKGVKVKPELGFTGQLLTYLEKNSFWAACKNGRTIENASRALYVRWLNVKVSNKFFESILLCAYFRWGVSCPFSVDCSGEKLEDLARWLHPEVRTLTCKHPSTRGCVCVVTYQPSSLFLANASRVVCLAAFCLQCGLVSRNSVVAWLKTSCRVWLDQQKKEVQIIQPR